MAAHEKLIEVALAEVGYLEKRDTSELYDKFKNGGSCNITKYWDKLKPSFQGEPWCDAFVDWCFDAAFGEATAQKLLCGGYKEFYTPTSAQRFKDKKQWSAKPSIGDQIFFKNSQRIYHTGIVYDVDSKYVYTVEGNTSTGEEVVPNGGAVCKKKYLLTNSKIAGYGHPDWNLVAKYPVGWNRNADTKQWWYQYGVGEDEYYRNRIVRINEKYYAFREDGYMAEGEAVIVTDENGAIVAVK